jgi:hypothetical protein
LIQQPHQVAQYKAAAAKIGSIADEQIAEKLPALPTLHASVTIL